VRDEFRSDMLFLVAGFGLMTLAIAAVTAFVILGGPRHWYLRQCPDGVSLHYVDEPCPASVTRVKRKRHDDLPAPKPYYGGRDEQFYGPLY
jgi:hypothetical protein